MTPPFAFERRQHLTKRSPRTSWLLTSSGLRFDRGTGSSLLGETMEPNEALGIAAQVAVTLAGFAGIVVIFLPESVHQWSRVDRFRLRLLLSNSIFPLAYSLFGMLMLTMKPAPGSIWQWCSAFAAVFQVPFAVATFTAPRRFTPAELKGLPKILFYPLFAIGIATLLLQFYNIVVLNRFWPFFAGIFVHLMAAMLQFVRLVLPPQSVIK